MPNVSPLYAVIDTNVVVSAMLSFPKETSPSVALTAAIKGDIVPLYNHEILEEYREVLSRDKFPFNISDVDALLSLLMSCGIDSERIRTDRELFPDPNDIVFYEVTLSRENAYLVTGNTKHFPQTPQVVPPMERVAILMRCRASL